MKKAVLFLFGCAVSFVVMVGQSGNAIASVEPISGIEPTAALDEEGYCDRVLTVPLPPGGPTYNKLYEGGIRPKCVKSGTNCAVIVITNPATPTTTNDCYVAID
ncbi:hypothetical protein [Nannocystis radixulma]|uniref:Uncharacterized protein n=1 Tax=Nannocystis radixulma TaxID=2995305 RepID=A0ABT5BD47_9BACT|nr:hypothetical protein [Nannocystis radixulma]MDC0672041.1 hypothetical protein [Nannocystis radixulma]